MSVTSGRDLAETLEAMPFQEFYEHEWRDVVGLGFVLTGSRWVAEDLAQDAFADAYRRWDRVSRMDIPGAWVRRVVANRSVSWFRRRAAERRALAKMGNPGPSAEIELDLESAELWAAVRTLPRRQQQAMALVYYAGMSIPETCRVMGCGQETARTHLKRGRRTLALRLGLKEDSDA